MTPPLSALSRRTALRLVLTAPLTAALTGCSRGDLDGLDRLRAPRSTPPAPVNADRPLVDAAVMAVADERATLAPYQGGDARIAELVRLHTAHLRSLDAAGAATGTATVLHATGVPLLDQVRTREEALGTLLAHHAAAAKDGRLARLLASMSAAIAQRTARTLR